jgi:hypothetical protein
MHLTRSRVDTLLEIGERRGLLLLNLVEQGRNPFLPLTQSVDPPFDLILFEKLLTHDAVNLDAQFSNAAFIDALQVLLFVDQASENIIAKYEISAGCDQPHCRDHQGEPNGLQA